MYTLLPKLHKKLGQFLFRHIASIFIFATLYYMAHHYLEGHGYEYKDPHASYTYWDFVYFSLGTQSTIGFGEAYPTHTLTKLIASAQLLSVAVLIMAAVM